MFRLPPIRGRERTGADYLRGAKMSSWRDLIVVIVALGGVVSAARGEVAFGARSSGVCAARVRVGSAIGGQ